MLMISFMESLTSNRELSFLNFLELIWARQSMSLTLKLRSLVAEYWMSPLYFMSNTISKILFFSLVLLFLSTFTRASILLSFS